MSRIYEALRQSELDTRQGVATSPLEVFQEPSAEEFPPPAEPSAAVAGSPTGQVTTSEKAEPAVLNAAELPVFPPAITTGGHLVSLLDERGLGAEKFRVLAMRLANLRRNSPLKSVQVTSSIVGEGKTLISCNLAVTLAKRSGQTVLLIEGDLRKPGVCTLFGLSPMPEGLGQWAQQPEGTPIQPYLRRITDTSLCLLPAGSVQHPVALLQSGRLADLMKQLVGWFDWVVVDTPPLMPMADSNLWARLVDGTLIVIRAGVVSRRALAAAVESLDGPKLVGVVMNDARDFSHTDYYDRYYLPESDRKAEAKESRKAQR
jgi:capsular exopolysaccharide synthesis family protein